MPWSSSPTPPKRPGSTPSPRRPAASSPAGSALAQGTVAAAPAEAIPLTALGKLRRAELAARLRDGRCGTPIRRGPAPPSAPPPRPETGVPAIWRAVLGLSGPLDPQANFFDLGGDSLRALALATRIGETGGGWIAPEAFFAEPTLATLERLVAEIGAAPAVKASAGPAAAAPPPWPLPDELRSRQLSLIETWDGSRPTRDRLVAGLKRRGAAAAAVLGVPGRHRVPPARPPSRSPPSRSTACAPAAGSSATTRTRSSSSPCATSTRSSRPVPRGRSSSAAIARAPSSRIRSPSTCCGGGATCRCSF